MSALAYQAGAGELVGADEATRDIRDNISKAREARKPYEQTWHSNLAFASGKFWLTWDRTQRRLVEDPLYANVEKYASDVITEYRTTALGELGSDDDRPELLLRRDDQPSEDFAEQLNKAVAWGWDYEWNGDSALARIDQIMVDLGTGAIRSYFDPAYGPVVGEVPHLNGVPVHDPSEQAALFEYGPNPDVTIRPVQRGRIVWDVGSPFNLVVPPGIPHEDDFPWECWLKPVLLSSVKKQYGDVAADLREDTDIGSTLGYDKQTANQGERWDAGTSNSANVKGHVWLFRYFERPCPDYPNGRTIVFASNKMKTLDIKNELPCKRPDGTPWSGISYFHWWRVTGRFWSRALIEPLKDPQRSINKRKTQVHDIIDRGLPFVIVEKNSKAKERKGRAVELMEIGPQEKPPQVVEGVRVGDWMFTDIQEMREDLVHASGIRGPRLGENPENVTTYAQLALLSENDQVKRQTIHRDRKTSIARLVEGAVYDMRKFWGPERQIALVGDEDMVDAFTFNAMRIPEFFVVKVAKGATRPRSQAAELKKVEDIWAAAQATVVPLNPVGWIEWFKDSLDAGQAQDLPEGGNDDHEDLAELENHRIIEGEPVFVTYYHKHEIHIPIHREVQMQAEEVGDLELWQRCEIHIQDHVLQQQLTAMQMQSMVPAEPMPGEMPMPDEEQPMEEPPA